MSTTATPLPVVTEPPGHCEYASGACDQDFASIRKIYGFFLYPSRPAMIANTIESAIKDLRLRAGSHDWRSWCDLDVSGQIVFCQICKAIRFSDLVVADVTTLNFNLLFEIGYAVGLGIPVLPIRDTSYSKDQRSFDELGLLDTLGYLDYQNSHELSQKLLARGVPGPIVSQIPSTNREQPLYVMKTHTQTDGLVYLMSALKKSGLFFRAFDPREVPRLSLHEAIKQVFSSLGVLVPLLSEGRTEAIVHNARCALVAGLAMAGGKHVLMLQEGDQKQPIDYRDVVRLYELPNKVPDLTIPLIKSVVETLQKSKFIPTSLPLKLLEKVDIGDLAAENEIKGLTSYFVPTGQYNEAKRGRARLIVGRKGAGKTAIFYGVRATYKPSKSHLVLDLKPEGHQFVKLREAVLTGLPQGVQQHVLTAFWNYLLLMEIARKIVFDDLRYSYGRSETRRAYQRVVDAYGEDLGTEQGDFSERLLALVDEISNKREDMSQVSTTAQVTELIYRKNIQKLMEALSDYLTISRRDDIWLLFDNIDKGWPVYAPQPEDILLLKSLLEATRKLQRQFEHKHIECISLVFLRNDIYQHLVLDPADRGKETAVLLDWNDPEVFKELLRRRIIASTGLEHSFEDLWPILFDSHVRGEDSFSYILSRTLMRPRELLRFVRECIDTAINRGREKVLEEDILFAEKSYSDDALVDLSLEMKDVNPEYSDLHYAFIGCPVILSEQQLKEILRQGDIGLDNMPRVIELLLWFGFLGIIEGADEERYAYSYQHDINKMQRGLFSGSYCIHPAFRRALGCS